MEVVIRALWLQGWERAPDVVRMNIVRWATLNPGARVDLLDDADVRDLLADVPVDVARIPPAALSDIVRSALLVRYGGVWTDASVYPSLPLGAWLEPLLAPTGFFAFSAPAPDRLLSSWFLAARPGHPLLLGWWERIVAYWSTPRAVSAPDDIPADPVGSVDPARPGPAPYFWFHYLFARTCAESPGLAELWAGTPTRSAGPAHALQAACAGQVASRAVWEGALEGAPVHKLDWRRDYPLDRLATRGLDLSARS